MKPTLDEFIQIGLKHGRANLHVTEPGFHHFYARFGRRYLNGMVCNKTLDIATIEVERRLQRTGVFTRLFHRLRATYPWMTLYVESASTEFQPLLRRLGFQERDAEMDCFFVLGDDDARPYDETQLRQNNPG